MPWIPLGLAVLLSATISSAAADTAMPAPAERFPEVREEPLEPTPQVARSDARDREDLVLTIYQGDLSLVAEQRRVGLPDGESSLLLEGISAALVPESLRLEVAEGVRVLAHRFRPAGLDVAALTDRHIGQDVTLVREGSDDASRERRVRLLGRDGETLIVRGDDAVEVLPPASGWRLQVDALPEDLLPRASVRVELDAETAGRRDAHLWYLTEGLAWKTDYILLGNDGRLSLEAIASIENRTGQTFSGASVRLVAGDTGRAAMPMARSLMEQDQAVAEEPAADFRLYTLDQAVSLEREGRTQLPLFRVDDLPLEREYRVTGNAWGQQRGGEQRQAVGVHLHLDAGPAGADRSLPAGIARVYQADASQGVLFLGEDRIPATAAGGHVELFLGTAFDLSATRHQTRYRRLDERSEEQGWQIRIRSTREEDSTVTIVERMPGDWTLLESSAEPRIAEPGRAVWSLEVPAGEEVELRYRAEVRR